MFRYTSYIGSSLPRSGIVNLTLSDHSSLSSALPWPSHYSLSKQTQICDTTAASKV